MLYLTVKTRIHGKYTITTITQQKHNKKWFVEKTCNKNPLCCEIVDTVTFYLTGKYLHFTTKQQKI
ncbi:hypothetical protein EZS27_016508 [termite gut metagenome]|uniref:Uncharacterized protein n=1 Tax=termite gut metagenome TaxID=433724 RepID=A0A5J4RMZ8_9ZZZZ